MNCLRLLVRCNRGFNSHSGHGFVCVCALLLFCVSVDLYLGISLATSGHSSKESYCFVYTQRKIKNVRVRYKRNGY
jgi:hypothetical protein